MADDQDRDGGEQEQRLREIDAALDVETDVDKVEGLLREREAVELKLTVATIAAQNRQRQDDARRSAADRVSHICTLRGRRAALPSPAALSLGRERRG